MPGPRILFGVLADHSAGTLRLLEDNMAAIAGWPERIIQPSWAVIIFNNRTSEWDRLPHTAARVGAVLALLEDGGVRPTRAKLTYQVRFARLLSDNATWLAPSPRQPVRAKRAAPSPRQPLLAEQTAPADYLWLPDSDMSFQRFRLDAFLARWRCAFAGGPPLLAQPLVLQRTQGWWHTTWDGWASGTTRRIPDAVPTSFVEVQVPLIDGGFFRFLAHDVAERLNIMGRHVNCGWGLDFVWSGAAKQYAPHRQAVALVLLPVSHLNRKTMRKGAAFYRKGFELLRQVAKMWPKWYRFPLGLVTKQVATAWSMQGRGPMRHLVPVAMKGDDCVSRGALGGVNGSCRGGSTAQSGGIGRPKVRVKWHMHEVAWPFKGFSKLSREARFARYKKERADEEAAMAAHAVAGGNGTAEEAESPSAGRRRQCLEGGAQLTAESAFSGVGARRTYHPQRLRPSHDTLTGRRPCCTPPQEPSSGSTPAPRPPSERGACCSLSA